MSETETVPAGTLAKMERMREALKAAEQFIVNGVELGFIRMTDKNTPDAAHNTLPMIRDALGDAT